MIIPLFATIRIDKDKILSIDLPLYFTSDYRHQAVVSDSFFESWFGNFDSPAIRYVPASEISPFVQAAISNLLSENPTVNFFVGDNLTEEAYDVSSLEFTESYQVRFTYQPGWATHHYNASATFRVGVDLEPDDLYTDLYPELIDNEEIMLSLKNWVNDTGSWDSYTDKDIAAMKLIEKYNQNVLLLRSTRKVDIENTVLTASTDGGSGVNLSGVENKLQSISDKLQTTEQIDNSQKSITDVLNQQANTIQVDEIGLLRSKKGYY